MVRSVGWLVGLMMVAAPSVAIGHDCAHEGRAPRGAIGTRFFERADGNGDGRVSLGEARAAALGRFEQADADRDGIVRREEAELWARLQRGRALEKRFRELDADRDGVVKERELGAGWRGFARFDLDRDGAVTVSELRRASSRERALGHGRSWLGRFETWDVNADGTITRAEVQSRVGQLFRDGDANRDGAFSRSELKSRRRAAR